MRTLPPFYSPPRFPMPPPELLLAGGIAAGWMVARD